MMNSFSNLGNLGCYNGPPAYNGYIVGCHQPQPQFMQYQCPPPPPMMSCQPQCAPPPPPPQPQCFQIPAPLPCAPPPQQCAPPPQQCAPPPQQPCQHPLFDINNPAFQREIDQIVASLSTNHQPMLRRQIITVAGAPGRVQNICRRLQTPAPDICETITVIQPQRDIINLNIEKPCQPQPQIQQRQICAPPQKPIINTCVTQVPHRVPQPVCAPPPPPPQPVCPPPQPVCAPPPPPPPQQCCPPPPPPPQQCCPPPPVQSCPPPPVQTCCPPPQQSAQYFNMPFQPLQQCPSLPTILVQPANQGYANSQTCANFVHSNYGNSASGFFY